MVMTSMGEVRMVDDLERVVHVPAPALDHDRDGGLARPLGLRKEVSSSQTESLLMSLVRWTSIG